ncbi:MAG: VCBS repeat-containing protein [Nitrospinaceae bacterium]|nr:VCBS repeat-containing protein [Nitrospinaceae bacterium]NIR55799.1 VCBS repeat-containing protein [Nitrospinaceae bacterium]NIS86252.1 VCBS repeat-containing protein [Nitrospinaceae bacterium]NIT83081.1 VCBS repeat-containing protein [Nitrospinaceae bacterium]NIU45291.1 VCBS repeat-containing protein [Nitrospinaceae bacterium]
MKLWTTVVCLGVSLALLTGCPSASKTQKKKRPLFAIHSALDTGKEPSFLITDDFDIDGNLDLVVLNSAEHTLSIFMGKGDGTFKDQVLYSTGADPICIVVADFNSDGFKDLAELNYQDQNVQIFLNTGRGGFKNTGKILKPGRIPINLTAGDFNEDGYPDLAVSLRYFKVAIMFGKGQGDFKDPVEIQVKGQPTGLIVGDYNHDQHTDIAVALAGSGNVGVEVLWGKGDGEFEHSKLFRGGGQPLTIANVDANNDGFMDLVTSSNSLHAMTLLLNNKDKTFKTLRDFSAGEFPKFVVAGDFTGDGIPDLAVSNSTNDTVAVTQGRGDGTFVYPPINHFVDEYPQGLVVGDFNKDGLMDIAVSCRDKNLLEILLKKGGGRPKALIPKPQTSPS